MNELQEAGRQGTSLPAVDSRGRKILYFSSTAIPLTILLDLMSSGQLGASAVVGLVIGGTAYYFEPEIHKVVGPVTRAIREVLAYLNRDNSGKSVSKLLNKDWWLGYEVTAYEEGGDEEEDEGNTEPAPETQEPLSPIPPQFVLGPESLAAIREINAKGCVYFGRSIARQVVLPIDEMYHVLDVAKSGRGKSNRFRNAMMQMVGMADTYYLNPFAAPVKAVTDSRKIEVWQPIYDRLANKRPMRESAEILETLEYLVDEIKRRNDLEQMRDFSWRKRPVFVFIDEVPEMYARCPDAVKYLDRIGRGGRQFGIFAWVATQTALVTDIGLSTASQAQFKTLLYGGGDKTSANRVMGSVSPEQEKSLKTNGAGLVLMVADGVDDTEYVRSPLNTNEALFSFLGLPPFQIDEWLSPVKSKQPVQHLGLSPFTLSPREEKHAQIEPQTLGERVKGERGERVKGPNEDAILDALNALEEDGKPLTLNAIAKKAGLTWHQYEEIEMVAAWAGYELDRGKGRPKEG